MSRDIFLHEFIDIVGQNAWPYMEHTVSCSGEEANGLEPVGLYEVLMLDTEVVTVFAGDVDATVKIGRAYDACRGLDSEAPADDRILSWRRRAREFCTRWREELMIPGPGTICAPE